MHLQGGGGDKEDPGVKRVWGVTQRPEGKGGGQGGGVL